MSSARKSKRFVPRLQTNERRVLLSATAARVHAQVEPHRPRRVHADGMIDLKPTQVGKDVLRALALAAPQHYRKEIGIRYLHARPTGMIEGAAAAKYEIPVLGELTSALRFRTRAKNPRVEDIQFKTDGFASNFIRKQDQQRVARAIIYALKRDASSIQALITQRQAGMM